MELEDIQTLEIYKENREIKKNNFNKMEFYNGYSSSVIGGIISKEEFLIMLLKINDKEDYNIISIIDPDKEHISNELLNGFNSKLKIKFWDIKNLEDEENSQYNSLSFQQGKEIRDFILKNRDKKFIIHCTAGSSRSAGVGLALEKLLNIESNIDKHFRYVPNMLVYNKIIEGIS